MSLETELSAHPCLVGLEPALVAKLAAHARRVELPAGAMLLRDGDDADVVYFLERGRVSLEVRPLGRAAVRVETVEPGSLVGLSWMFPPYRVHLDARAIDPVVALAIDARWLRQAMDDDHALGCAMRKRLLRTTFERLERVRMQRLDVYGENA